MEGFTNHLVGHTIARLARNGNTRERINPRGLATHVLNRTLDPSGGEIWALGVIKGENLVEDLGGMAVPGPAFRKKSNETTSGRIGHRQVRLLVRH